HLWPRMHNDLEVRRHIFQHLALVRADTGQPAPAALRADVGSWMFDALARQMRGQRFADRDVFSRAWHNERSLRMRFHEGVPTRRALRLAFFEIPDGELKLLDLTIELFG